MGRVRKFSYGEYGRSTIFEHFGVWLSSRRMKKELVKGIPPENRGKLIDLGGGV